MEQKVKKATSLKILVFILFFLVVVLPVSTTIKPIYQYFKVKSNGVMTTAYTQNVSYTYKQLLWDTVKDYTIDISYTVDDCEYTAVLKNYNKSMDATGTVTIFYAKDNPTIVTNRPETEFTMLTYYMLIIVFIIISWFIWKSKGKTNSLCESGTSIQCVVTDIVKKKDRDYYILECSIFDEVTNTRRIYRSESIHRCYNSLLGKTVTVYVDSNNPHKYYVDINTLLKENGYYTEKEEIELLANIKVFEREE